jgi:copper(I)-binding protein
MSRNAFRALLCSAALVGLSAPALAQPAPEANAQSPVKHGAAAADDASYRAGDLLIEQPWSRATPGGAKVAGGYVRVTNKGASPDRLVGGTFAAAGRMEVHEMSVTDGIMRMKPVDAGVAIPPGATVELKPGGYHAMFLDLRHPLKEGDTVQGTLQFEKAGSVPVTYRVLGMGAQNPGIAHGH